MNTESARAAKEFAKIVRRDPGNVVIVQVPGHNGNHYYVKVTERTVACKRSNGTPCPSIGTSTLCYHSLAAWEYVHEPVSWCDCEQKAKKLENLGNHAVEVRSTQGRGAKAWAVKKGKPVNESERLAVISEMAQDYATIFGKVQDRQSISQEEHERLQECRRQFGILKMAHGEIVQTARKGA